MAGFPRAAISNGGMETPGERGLPANWQITWNNSGTGEVFLYDRGGTDSFEGNSVLRLHVTPGGGSTFVLSDSFPVSSDAVYVITSRMRYHLTADSVAVYFSVIQFDGGGSQVGFDETIGVKGHNFWTWAPKALLIRTMPGARSIRIRFGLAASAESYLDVDAVR